VLASGTLRGRRIGEDDGYRRARRSDRASGSRHGRPCKPAAATGIYINTNSAAPAMVNVLALTNITSGDIVLNAHGGATDDFPGEQSRRQRSPSIRSARWTSVAGITAGNSIFLSTGGSPSSAANDMSLAGLYTYNISTVHSMSLSGVGGALTLFTGSTPLF